MALHYLVVEIFESEPYPIVTHIFTGKTQDEACRAVVKWTRS